MASERDELLPIICKAWIDHDLEEIRPIIRACLSNSSNEQVFLDFIVRSTIPTRETIAFMEQLIMTGALSVKKVVYLIVAILTACCQPERDLALVVELFQRYGALVFPTEDPEKWIKETISVAALTRGGLGALKTIMSHEVFRDEHTIKRDVVRYATRMLITDQCNISPTRIIKLGNWIDTQILVIVADAKDLASPRHQVAVLFLIDLLERMTEAYYPTGIQWLANLAPDYFGHLVSGKASPDSVPEWCRTEHLIQRAIRDHYEYTTETDIQEQRDSIGSNSSAMVNAILRRVADHPENWLSLLEIGPDSTITISEACESGRLKINAIGLFRMACQEDLDIAIWANLDPSACITIRSELHSMAIQAAERYDFGGYLETWTTECTCRCSEIGIAQVHTDPLPVIQDHHAILSDLVMRCRLDSDDRSTTIDSLRDLAEYTREYDLVVHYYLVDDIILLVHSSRIRYPNPSALKVIGCEIKPTKTTYRGRPVVAIDCCQERAPYPSDVLASVSGIFAKSARS